MDFRSFPPASFLCPYIERYWYAATPGVTGEWNQTWLPTVMHCLVFDLNNNISSLTETTGEEKLPPCFMLGNLTRPGHNIVKGPMKVFAVHFTPTGIYQLFNIALHTLLDRAVDFEHIEKETIARELKEKMGRAPTPDACMGILEPYFAGKLLHAVPNRKITMLAPVVQFILSHKGHLQIQELTQQSFYTKKTLERHFVELVGPTPKQFQSIVRFNAAVECLQKNNPPAVKDFIYDLGYFDHAHFLHDFKKLSGKTPQEVFSQVADHDEFFYGH